MANDDPSANQQSSTSSKRPDELVRQKALRTPLRTFLTKAVNALENLVADENSDVGKIEDQLKVVIKREDAINECDQNILAQISDEAKLESEYTDMLAYQDKIDVTIVKSKASRRIRDAAAASSKGSTNGESANVGGNTVVTINNEQGTRLPTLAVPKFSGDITEFEAFWSRFKSTVDDKEKLTKVEKFNYLAQYLEGDAKSVIAGMNATAVNYTEAIKLLKDRFCRTDLVIHTHGKRLMNLEQVKDKNDTKALRNLYDQIQLNLRSLMALNVDITLSGTFLCPLLVSCLPDELRLAYSKAHKKDGEWNINAFVEFLLTEVEALETSAMLGKSARREKAGSQSQQQATSRSYEKYYPSRPSRYEDKPRNYTASANSLQTNVAGRAMYCIFCKNNNHGSASCGSYTLDEKRYQIRDQRRCFICLKLNHDARRCDSNFRTCKICRGKHNYVVCEKNEAHKKDKQDSKSEGNTEIGANTIIDRTRQNVLLQTAKILVNNPDYPNSVEMNTVRCVLDNGSQGTFVLEEISKTLRLPVIGEQSVLVTEFGNENPVERKRKIVRITLQNWREPEKKIQVEAIEVPYICRAKITNCEEIQNYVQRTGIKLADDPSEASPSSSKIGILVGGDYYYDIVTGNYERLKHKLVALDTLFGWTIQGPTSTPIKNVGCVEIKNHLIAVLTAGSEENRTSNILRSFWELEAIGIESKQERIPEGEEVLAKFEDDVRFDEKEGRYLVKFPWNTEQEALPDNKAVATKRMNGLIRRFKQDPQLYESYKKVVTEQLEMGIAEEVPMEEIKSKPGTYYLPHQAVKREARSTTKLRVVFDASSHINGAPSLNDCLDSGPNLNPDLLLLLLRFRKHEVAICSDIEKAFLQVGLAPEDKNSVRFFWAKEENGKIDENNFKTLRMARVPFGVTASPYLLAATIKHHLKSYAETEPETVSKLNQDLYVDDFLTGSSSAEDAYKLSTRASEILSDAKMHLRKWQTNSAELREMWGNEAENPDAGVKFEIQENESQKILGLLWNPNSDTFSFDLSNLVTIFQQIKTTKRYILSAVSQIFDPVGILAPYTIRAKFLFQTLWERGFKWDEELPKEIGDEFKQWSSEMPQLRQINLARCYYKTSPSKIIKQEIHCFCDASTRGYAAVVYLSYQYEDQTRGVSLITSKTRVAPLKRLTLPRLELLGCLLGARLVSKIEPIFETENIEKFLWTDSKIALHWVKGSTKTWKPFVQNRATEIQALSDPKNWFHCPGTQNPADIPTRGAKASELTKNQLWWEGPTWLKNDKAVWPDQEKASTLDCTEVDEEKRKTILAVVKHEKTGINEILDVNKFSKINKLFRITSYIYRIVDRARKIKHFGISIEANEMHRAETKWIQCIQKEDYADELKALQNNSEINRSSKISTLKPILNQENLICVGGRLSEADLPYEIKHPVIVNKETRLAKLIMDRCHEEMSHGGIQSTLSQSRNKYWITSGRQLARKSVKSCLTCRRVGGGLKPGDADMAPLPKDRIERAASFEIVGIGFAGPLFVKRAGSIEKAYICLFTCSVVRAVHLELVTSLTSQEFLLALIRMISKRGIPRKIYSDNAKTFNRANKDLAKIWDSLKSEEVLNFYGRKGITWHFIVERAAWYGGWWEVMVKSTKTILKKILGRAQLSYVEMETALVQAEAAINSRPLTYVSSDSNDPETLTPAHFLIGKPITSLPTHSVKITKAPKTQVEMTKRQKYRNALMDRFWLKWKNEYLLALRTAHNIKIAKTNSKIKSGDVMMIHDDKTPKHLWKLGVVTETLKGRDGTTRSCMIRTSNGNFIRRPIQLLYPLEIDAISVRENDQNVN